MQDLISIIIPAYNGEKYIKECIESIQKQKMNTEIIVVDDISTDNTARIARDSGCRVIINREHKGQIAGKNTGIREAKGTYWLTIDQDDMLTDGALKKLVEEIEKEPDTKIVMAKLKDFCSADSPEQIRFCKPYAFWGILTGAALFKKEIFSKIGFWNENAITGDVIDLTTRLIQNGIEIRKADFVSCRRRIHCANYGRTNQKEEYKDYANALRVRLKSLHR